MSDVLDSNTHFDAPKENLPSSDGVLAMGIISIVFAGLVGLILGIIAISISAKSMAMYNENPDRYTEPSFRQLSSGRICAIIGLCISGVALLFVLFTVIANS